MSLLITSERLSRADTAERRTLATEQRRCVWCSPLFRRLIWEPAVVQWRWGWHSSESSGAGPTVVSRLESHTRRLHTDCMNPGEVPDASVLVSEYGYLSVGYCEGEITKAKSLGKFLSYSKSAINISHFSDYYWALTLYFIDLYSVER